MTTVVAGKILVTAQDQAGAREVLAELEGPQGFLAVGQDDEIPEHLPREVGLLLQSVLEAVVAGSNVTIVTTPEEITTSTAAGMLSISRPTLMRLARDGEIPSHKVGTHTRFMVSDVLAYRTARRRQQRAALEALLELEGDEE